MNYHPIREQFFSHHLNCTTAGRNRTMVPSNSNLKNPAMSASGNLRPPVATIHIAISISKKILVQDRGGVKI